MAVDEFEFMNRVGVEMWDLLMMRADEELEGVPPRERISILVSAALIPVASVWRVPLLAAPPANRESACQQFLELTTKRLRHLLDQIPGASSR